jgi:hypothetical protein
MTAGEGNELGELADPGRDLAGAKRLTSGAARELARRLFQYAEAIDEHPDAPLEDFEGEEADVDGQLKVFRSAQRYLRAVYDR